MHRVVTAQWPINRAPGGARRIRESVRRALGPAIGIAALSVLPLVALDANAANERPPVGRIPTVTRLVKLFLDREASIGDAIRNGDAQALGNLLTDDFEMRTGMGAAAPIPRADWMRAVLRTREGGNGIEGMAVHDYGTIEIVSFTMSVNAGAVFVVDVWQRQGDAWKLAVRYAGPVGTPQFLIPGAEAAEPEIPKKY